MQITEPTKSKILFVDDDPAIIDLFQISFAGEYDIYSASSGDEALEVYTRNPDIGVILSDYKMPGMSGIELLTRIYQINPETIRIVVTAYAEYESILEAINHGHVYQYVIKPWEPDHLEVILERGLTSWKLIRENRQMVKDMARMNEMLKKLSHKLLHAEENERKRISMELHDDIGQNLIALKLQFKNLCSQLDQGDSAEIEESKSIVMETLQNTIDNTRNLCSELNPIIDEYGFDAIFAEFLQNFDRDYGVTTSPAKLDIQHYFNKGDQHQLYRILQEILNNIGKHSGTDRVFIDSLIDPDFLTIQVSDQGCGFDPDNGSGKNNKGGHGLDTIHQRTTAMGGTIDIQSTLQKGTKFIVRLPISH
jgi:signal transduction histidine kinase